ncbi:cap-specific mRNA (nucleoside-2'-O-)-methyltransferase 2-like isoform X2 [Episyrphus balteatus]|uniref:cap-specific mRNA (nucleoside-2'-O-)-methyltransferase 2-like isoform X2 n=1 Tax=Episyrphus balteatus TaxID=286459 RepID=UPI002486C14F|nr:cap-specific mRNA (nucleoside-2'-O-)-methyltransferase 2-like isoform X2 [Episyrphus balteatus]
MLSCPDNLQNQIQLQPNSPPNHCTVSGGRNPIEKHQYIFEKKYKYSKAPGWTLPPVDELFKEFYQFDNLQQLKHDLNATKSKLNDYVLEDWSVHTRKKDPSGEIPWKLKNDIQAEFVTVAWCKLFECLHQYKMVKDGKLNSLHLCEAPGAFIAALNHYLHSTFDEVQWQWLSTTLNPYYEGNPLNKMIIDDRFMLHTLDRWLFHKDFSGNILDCENIKHMAKECKERLGDVHLITADGSIDCIETPDNQEELVSNLHFAELCAALLILAKGGSFLLKMFTLFEAASVNVVFFLNCIFEEVSVFKPGTSKRGNSELYLVCLNYLKPDNIGDYLDAMLDKLATNNIFPLFPKKYIPLDFYIQHEVCNRKFMFEQMQAIESNIYSYELKSKWENKKSHELRSQVCQLFFERFKVQPLKPEQKILQNPRSKIEYGIKTQIYRGSHNKRICIKNLSTEEQLFHLRKAFNEIEKVILWQYDDIGCLIGSPEEKLPLKVFRGKPLQELGSSLFANMEILFLRQKIGRLIIQIYGHLKLIVNGLNLKVNTRGNFIPRYSKKSSILNQKKLHSKMYYF